ncbi:hypothetical protein HYH03_016730 [Edaphochlamys debaryana]|uniref:Ubiquitin-like domain-containing protein n=1 Tax=Edaphochlamys debaryana TaxID=47281 RepID=A0A835XIM5_9CHLO|nr:hypothetical protein HYH03_016730 [Edaphochlamys debaryana]|eukprot:KAG2484501.1 hypothetical protein HYH03_016730 [Edaphochlamys debaryana]
MLASERGHTRVVRLLLEAGADVKATTKGGATALSLAAAEGHADVIPLLVEAGADVNAADQKGTPLLGVAAHRGHTEVVRALLRAGAEQGAQDAEGNTALHLAAAAGREGAVEALLQASTDHGDLQNEAGYTALHLAKSFTLETSDGHTLRDLAMESGNGHVELSKLMWQAEEERLPRFRVRVYVLKGPDSCRLKDDPVLEFSPSEDVGERRSGTTCLRLSQLRPALDDAGIPDGSARVLLLEDHSCGSLGRRSTELPGEELRGGGVEVAFPAHCHTEPDSVRYVSLVLLNSRQPPPRIPLELRGPWGVRTETLQADVTHGLGEAVRALLPTQTGGQVLRLQSKGRHLWPSRPLLGTHLSAKRGVVAKVLGPPSIEIYVKSLRGVTATVGARPEMMVEEFRQAYAEVEGIPPEQQRLMWAGEQLEDGRTLSECGLKDRSTLYMIDQLRGGKPVICIWAADPMDLVVRLQLSCRWAFSSLVPRPDVGDGKGEWGTGGRVAEWRVAARPDGSLVHPGSGGREYSYLFWEALTEGAVGVEAAAGGRPALLGLGPTPPDLPLPDFTPSRSFCVSGAEAEAWLYGALQAFGVPTRERTDFLTYWKFPLAGFD